MYKKKIKKKIKTKKIVGSALKSGSVGDGKQDIFYGALHTYILFWTAFTYYAKSRGMTWRIIQTIYILFYFWRVIFKNVVHSATESAAKTHN